MEIVHRIDQLEDKTENDRTSIINWRKQWMELQKNFKRNISSRLQGGYHCRSEDQ